MLGRAMDQGDVFEYGGHARYGTGPDFDRNYRFTVDWDKVAGSAKTGTEEFATETHGAWHWLLRAVRARRRPRPS